MLQVYFRTGPILRACAVALLACASGQCADETVVPLTVCEIVADLPALDGKVLAVIGRYSFRATGRWMAEQTCDAPGPTPELTMVEDPKEAPKPPEHLNLDSAALKKKFMVVQKRSTLVNFRFGTSDYDRWAVVYGRVERKASDGAADAAHKSPANLVFRGSSVIIVITPGEW